MNELLLREDLIIEEERLMMFKLCENGIFVKNAKRETARTCRCEPTKNSVGAQTLPPPSPRVLGLTALPPVPPPRGLVLPYSLSPGYCTRM